MTRGNPLSALRKKAEIDRVFARGVRRSSTYFRLRQVEGGLGRVVVMVSKKTAKRAVDRNRIRRRTRALLDARADRLLTKDTVVLPEKSVLTALFPALREDLDRIV